MDESFFEAHTICTNAAGTATLCASMPVGFQHARKWLCHRTLRELQFLKRRGSTGSNSEHVDKLEDKEAWEGSTQVADPKS